MYRLDDWLAISLTCRPNDTTPCLKASGILSTDRHVWSRR